MVLAHPLTQHGSLPVSPLVAAILGVLAVAVVSYWRTRPGEVPPERPGPFHSWEGDLGTGMVAGRVVGVALLALAILAGRAGEDFQLENLAPSLVVGAGWPLLILASAAVGPVWRWLDPWDGTARRAGVDGESEPAPAVHWAGVTAFAWVAYSSAYFEPLEPRAVGAALAIYSIATVGGCFVFGRRPYLARAEVFGLLFGWVARLPRRALSGWRPPAGAELVLGVLAGGLLFGALRRSELWGSLNIVEGAALYSAAGIVGASVAGGGLMAGLQRWASARRAPGVIAVALVPAVASLAFALALAGNVLFTSVQLLPNLFGDPFGLGWDLLGPAGRGLDPAPLGSTGLVVAQLIVLFAGHAVGACCAARRVDAGGRLSPTLALSVTMAGGTIAVMTMA